MIDIKNVEKVLQDVTGKDFLDAERQARQMGGSNSFHCSIWPVSNYFVSECVKGSS